MQQRQLRLGDILDDYCPRERRVTNHAVVAMIGDEVKQTRCTTCDSDHEYKHARVPRQRRKPDTPAALYSQVAASAPKRVAHEGGPESVEHADGTAMGAEAAEEIEARTPAADVSLVEPGAASTTEAQVDEDLENDSDREAPRPNEFESVHRPLIRATLPRHEGQQAAPQRQAPDFTIRQPGGRPGRFRPRHQRGAQMFGGGDRANGGNFGQSARGPQRQHGGRSQGGSASRPGRHRHQGPPPGKRSK